MARKLNKTEDAPKTSKKPAKKAAKKSTVKKATKKAAVKKVDPKPEPIVDDIDPDLDDETEVDQDVETTAEEELAPTKVKKVSTPAPEKKKKEETPTGFIQDLLLAKKHTDEEIFKKVQTRFGDLGAKTNFANISLVRSDINHGLQAKKKIAELGVDLPILRYVQTDKGLVGMETIRKAKNVSA